MEFFFIRSMIALMSFRSTNLLAVSVQPARPAACICPRPLNETATSNRANCISECLNGRDDSPPSERRQGLKSPLIGHIKAPKNRSKRPILGELFVAVNGNDRFKRQNVGIHAKSGYLTPADGRDERSMTEFFAGEDVGDVDFNGRNRHRRNGVPEGNTGMGVSGGIQDDDLEFALRGLDPIHQFTLDVRLAELDLALQLEDPFPTLR